MVTRIAGCVTILATLAVSGVGSSWSARPPTYRALVGVNYSHFSNNGRCTAHATTSLDGTGILANYQRRGVAARVSRQLTVMRTRGIQTLRLILWHQTNAGRRQWGVVSSAGGRLSSRVRTAFVAYLRAARNAGFAQLTVSFGPVGSNDPASPSFDPTKLDENWQLVRQVRFLARRYGPQSIHIDLENEAPPNSSDAGLAGRVGSYLAEMYRRYVQAYGNQDVSVSTIASQAPSDTRARLQNLIAALRSTGLPLPLWFDVHPSYSDPLRDLQVVDQVLADRGLDQPLVLSEVAYDDPGTADAVAQFEQEGHRSVLEVTEWPLTRDRPCLGMSVSPPYRADVYTDRLATRAG
jgi:hypothetical protein